MPRLSVIIPVYNEKDTIDAILNAVSAVDLSSFGVDKEIIVVDDCSADGTSQALAKWEEKGVRVIRHQRRQGKGASVKTAFKEYKGDLVIVQDADLEYDPQDYKKLLPVLLDGRADIVYGSRFLGPGPASVLSLVHYLGNKCITNMCNLFTGLHFTDMETCYKLLPRRALDKIILRENDFGFDVELTMKLARKKFSFCEVGISYYARDYDKGKKIRWTDGVRALYLILKYAIVW
jgi:glycosyltransferase involved in cell wall biosynthesis